MQLQLQKSVKKLLLCSGKIYYELEDYKIKNNKKNVAIVRIEQLYPFPGNMIKKVLNKYKTADKVWVQEEPLNMGGWSFILQKLRKQNIDVVSRKASASPATGFKKIHDEQQFEIIKKAFA